MKKKELWKQIGVIGVDAGLCWIGDPCYVVSKDASHVWDKWSKFCDDTTHMKLHQQFNYKMGHEGLGVCVSSGYGDGEYPVFAKIKDGRVQEVKVKFF